MCQILCWMLPWCRPHGPALGSLTLKEINSCWIGQLFNPQRLRSKWFNPVLSTFRIIKLKNKVSWSVGLSPAHLSVPGAAGGGAFLLSRFEGKRQDFQIGYKTVGTGAMIVNWQGTVNAPKGVGWARWVTFIPYLLDSCVHARLSCFWLFATPWTVAHQAPLSTLFSRQKY